ncbi:unnamed protein product, partial [Meganyctiphanes norvegica]
MRCSDLLLLHLLLGAALSLLVINARSIENEELQHPVALSDEENGSGDQVITSEAPSKDQEPKKPIKAKLKESKRRFDADKKEIKRTKSKEKTRSKRTAVPTRQKGQPLVSGTEGRSYDTPPIVRMEHRAGVSDLSSQIRKVIAQFSARHTEETQEQSEVGDIVSALSEAIRSSQQRVEDHVMHLTQENSAQMSAVVAAVNQSADSLASLAETAEETHGFLASIAQTLGSINAKLHQHLHGIPLIGTAIPLVESTTATYGTTCTGDAWENYGDGCIHISSRSPELNNRLNWHDARSYCRSQGGALLEPDDVYYLYNFLNENNLYHDYWIGGSKSGLDDETQWEWLSGKPIVSDAWSAQPRADRFLSCLNFSSQESLPLSSGHCFEESYYICQQLLPTSTTENPTWSFSMKWSTANATERPTPQGLCEEPYFKVGSECFRAVDESLPWHDARSYCQDEGSDLAEPEDLDALKEYLVSTDYVYDYWLGGTDEAEEGEWLWVSGRPLREEWMQGSGDFDGGEDQDCFDFRPDYDNDYPVNDFDCSHDQRFICEKPMDAPIEGGSVAVEAESFIELMQEILRHPDLAIVRNETQSSKNETESPMNDTTENPTWSFAVKWSTANTTEKPLSQVMCSEPYFVIGSECFRVVDEALTWHDARSHCQAEGDDLAEPEDIQIFRQHLLDDRYTLDYWLGGTDEAVKGEWVWLSGRPVEEEWWMQDQPNRQGEDDQQCLDFQTLSEPFFNDFFCSHEQAFICEKPMEHPSDGGSVAVEAASFIELLQGILTHPVLSLAQNDTQPSNNETESSNSNNQENGLSSNSTNQVNDLFQFLNLFTSLENSGEKPKTPESSNSTNQVNDLFQFFNLFKPSENSNKTPETPGDAITNNMNGLFQGLSEMIHGAFSQQDGWCRPPLELIGSECFFISDVLVDADNAAVESEMTWDDARQFCEENGGDLAEPSDPEALKEIMTDGVLYWIGSEYDESESTWKWVSGKTATFNISTDLDANLWYCSILYDMEGSIGFDAYDCEKTQRWICEKPNPNEKSVNETTPEILVSPLPSAGSIFLTTGWTNATNACITGKNDKVLRNVSSLDDCRSRCQAPGVGFYCRSVEYNSVARRCVLSKSDSNSFNFRQQCHRRKWVFSEIIEPNPNDISVNETTPSAESISLSRESCKFPFEVVGSQCLYVGENEATWQEAQKMCQNMNGNLAEVLEEQDSVINFLSRKAGQWSWAWIARTSSSNNNQWLRSQTSVRGRWVEVPDETYDGCLKLGVEYGGYKPYDCTDGGGHYICERKVNSTVSSSEEESEHPYVLVGSELFLVRRNLKLSWSMAQRDCQQHGGYLAEPQNLTGLRNYMIKHDYDDDYWIGGSDQEIEGKWIWTGSGNPIIDEWMEDQPSGETSQNCLDFQPKKIPSLNDYSCGVTQNYICQKDYQPSDPTESTVIPETDHGNYKRIGTEMFLVVKQKLSWPDAREHCKQNGGDLAAPDNLELLQNYLKDKDELHDYWLGGTDEAKEGTWTWLGGASIANSWKSSQPSGGRAQNCLDFRSASNPSLNDYECDEPQYFICETEDSSLGITLNEVITTTTSVLKLEDCNEPFFQIGNECFLVVKEEKTWRQAQDYCENQGASLAVPTTQDELKDYLQENGLIRDYWLGATDEAEEGTWISVMGEPIIWPNNVEIPINENENCLDFRTDRTPSYYDYYCENEQYFICERVSSDPVTDSTTPMPEDSCEYPFVMIGSECFKIVPYQNGTWYDARLDCKNNGGDLAVPSNLDLLQIYLEENDMINDYWLGGSDEEEEGTWLWLTGEEITSGFDDGEPYIDNTENCLDFRADDIKPLHDYYCSSTQAYICEKPLASIPPRNGIEAGLTLSVMETNQCTVQTFIGLTRRRELIDTELTLSKQYGRIETINITNEESHTFEGVDPGIYTLCVHTRLASNPKTQSNCTNFVVESE